MSSPGSNPVKRGEQSVTRDAFQSGIFVVGLWAVFQFGRQWSLLPDHRRPALLALSSAFWRRRGVLVLSFSA